MKTKWMNFLEHAIIVGSELFVGALLVNYFSLIKDIILSNTAGFTLLYITLYTAFCAGVTLFLTRFIEPVWKYFGIADLAIMFVEAVFVSVWFVGTNIGAGFYMWMALNCFINLPVVLSQALVYSGRFAIVRLNKGENS